MATDDDKRAWAYLLFGNSPLDLMEGLWPHVSEEYKKEIREAIQEVKKEDPETDYLDIFNQCEAVNNPLSTIWR